MQPPPIDEIDDDAIADMYDNPSVARGRAYARQRRVTIVSSEPGAVTAVCRGSGSNTYLVRVRWHAASGGIYLVDECSCPLLGLCKHCVASLIVAREQARRRHLLASHTTALDVRPDWRKSLFGLSTLDDDLDGPGLAAMGLQFAVTAPKSTRYQSGTDHVAVRPIRRGKKGGWVKTGVSWSDLTSSYRPPDLNIDPKQRSALRALAASSRSPYYSGSAAVNLDQFGPDLWYHLERLVELGVELVSHAGYPVELAANAARPQIDVTSDDAGTITVLADLALDGSPVAAPHQIGELVGTPPHGMWTAEGDALRLIAFEAPLHPTVASLIERGPLPVPVLDADELLDAYLPALARHATVASSDGSVTITVRRFDRLLLTVARTGLDTAEVRWSARYRRGERITDHPLRLPGSRSGEVAAEATAIAELDLPTHLLPGLIGEDGRPRNLRVDGQNVIVLLTDVVPWLDEHADIDIEVIGDQPTLRAATEDPLISLAVRDAKTALDGNDWFDLDITVSVDGETIDFVSLFTALHRGDETLILPSGTWLTLDRPEFDKLRDLLDEANGLSDPTSDATARVNRFQADWWEELSGLGVVAEQSERWSRAVDHMAALSAPEHVDLPAGLDATLRPYQQEGFDWLAFLYRNELGGVLADDMGLGKTVQTLALCLHVQDLQPDARFLVVAPTSVVDNWAREAARFAPGLAVRTITETQARRGTPLSEAIAGADLIVTSYALFRLEIDQYEAHDWNLLLLDEAQFVKNHQSKTYQCARRLRASTKIAITGTPLENTLMDLWSLLSIAAPGLYPDPKRFSDTYRRPIESGDAPELLSTLRRRIAPLMRRRTKDAVLTELPPKIEQTIEVELSAKHARIYATQLQRQRQRVLGLVGDVTRHRFEILRSLTLLRQLALDPGLVDDEHDHIGSAKLDRLLEDLTQVVAEGHRALVFSQFTRYLAKVRTRLDAAGIDHAYLDGRTRKRAEAIAKFKEGDAPVFVISLKAGGFGLNLTEADYCFVLDPWWNPATETQAVDRAHRIGQPNPVVVYRYVSANTIEEKVLELKARKANLFDRVIGDDEGALAGALTETDIRSLLDLS